MNYVIGIDGGLTKCRLKAKDMQGNLLAEKVGSSTNHQLVGVQQAGRRLTNLIEALLADFGGKKEDCCCVLVGATGIDSPDDKLIVEGLYARLMFRCPIFCMNDGEVALYSVTKGVGVLAIAGTGSIAIGRNAGGSITRSGGYSINILGDEGSGQWIGLSALRYISQWIDGSIPASPLIDKLNDYFHGMNANKLIQYSVTLRRRSADPKLGVLVYEAAKEGDLAAIDILKKGANNLFLVAETVVKKLGFDKQPRFLSGVWGSVFVKNEIYYNEYKRLFEEKYPNCHMVFPIGDAADGAAQLALDYLANQVSFVPTL